MVNWLPNFKETLDNAFQDYVKTPLERSTANFTKLAEAKANELNSKLEQKANEFESKGEAIAQEFQTNAKHFQHAIITLLFASFCVGIIAFNWKEDNKVISSYKEVNNEK